MMIGKKLVAVSASAMLVLGTLVGCGPQAPQYDLVIGEESETALTLAMTNGTGQAIEGFSFMESGGEEFPASMMAEGDAWEPDAVAQLFLEADVQEEVVGEIASEADGAEETDSDGADVAAAEDIVLNPVYDMQFMLADGSSLTLHNLVLSDLVSADDLVLMVDGESGLAYLTYVEDGSEVSTLDAEIQFKEAAEAAKAAAEAAAAEAEAQAQAAADAAAAQAAVVDSSYSAYEAPSGGSVSQGSDSCVGEGDLILN